MFYFEIKQHYILYYFLSNAREKRNCDVFCYLQYYISSDMVSNVLLHN